MPQGGALILALFVCATVGAAVGGTRLEGRHFRLVGIVLALCIAQFLGHLILVAAGGHHHPSSGLGLTPSMVAAHAAAAIILGVAITAVEYLYVVCASVLRWLRLFATRSTPPASRAPVCRAASVPVLQSVLLRTGLGVRAPPWGAASPA